MDGPVICAHCDMGLDRDGQDLTEAAYAEQYRNFTEATVALWVVQAIGLIARSP